MVKSRRAEIHHEVGNICEGLQETTAATCHAKYLCCNIPSFSVAIDRAVLMGCSTRNTGQCCCIQNTCNSMAFQQLRYCEFKRCVVTAQENRRTFPSITLL